MKAAKITLNEPEEDYIRLVNPFFNLTDKEIDIVAELIRNDKSGVTRKSKKDTASKLGFTANSFSNYIKKIKDKGAIDEDDRFHWLLLNDDTEGISFYFQ